jgi:hypothetical protein
MFSSTCFVVSSLCDDGRERRGGWKGGWKVPFFPYRASEVVHGNSDRLVD